MNAKDWPAIVKGVAGNIVGHGIPGRAIEMSFYFFLCLFPVLLVGLSVLGLFFDAQSVIRETLVDRLAQVAPDATSRLYERLVAQVSTRPERPLGVGLVIALWAASSGMVATIRALNRAYRVQEERPWWKRRLVAIALTGAFMLLSVTAMILLASGSRIADLLGLSALLVSVWTVAQWPVIVAFLVLAFQLLYRYALNRRTPVGWLQAGTLTGVGLWLAASLGVKLYVENVAGYNIAYGPLGAVIVVLLWFYFTSVAVLLGAEVNAQIESSRSERYP